MVCPSMLHDEGMFLKMLKNPLKLQEYWILIQNQSQVCQRYIIQTFTLFDYFIEFLFSLLSV